MSVVKKTKLLEDVKCHTIALVKSPANATRFYIVKGGDLTVDGVYEAIAEICKGEELSAFEKRAIPDDQMNVVGKAVLAMKAAFSDLPEGLQEAMKVLAKSSLFNFEKAVEDPKVKVSPDEVAAAISALESKMGASDKVVSESMAGVTKTVESISTRLEKLEKSIADPSSAAPTKKKVEKAEEDTWQGVIPDCVIARREE